MFKKLAKLFASAKPNIAPAAAPEKQKGAISVPKFSPNTADKFEKAYQAIVRDAGFNQGRWSVGFGQNKAYQYYRKTWSLELQQGFVAWLVDHLKISLRRSFSVSYSHYSNSFYSNILDALMGSQLINSPVSAVGIGRLFLENKAFRKATLLNWPVKKFIRQLERRYKDGLEPEREVVVLIREYMVRLKNERALVSRLRDILGEEEKNQPFMFVLKGDHFGGPMNSLVVQYGPENQLASLLHHASTATTGKPSKKWLATASGLLKTFDQRKARAFICDFLELLRTTPKFENARHWYDNFKLLQSENGQTVKGLLWIASLFNEVEFSRKLSKIAIMAYKKVPNKGPLDTKVGNACVTALSITKGMHGISQLAGLGYRIKQTGIRKKIDKILQDVAKKKGVSRQEMEDLSVMELGLKDDLLAFEIGDYIAEIRLIKPGKSVLTWRKGSKEQKSIPKAIKDEAPNELKEIRAHKKGLETDSINLRDRIDWNLRLNREMTRDYFEDTWQKNTLLNYFVNRLIWIFSEEDGTNTIAAIRGEEGWEDKDENLLDLKNKVKVRLWHPALATPKEVEQWRKYLLKREISQPLKQAFREVYLLTAAEERTATYSNRMAAHILKQHQFANLARGRGWAYSLIGAFDHGMSAQACYQNLPELGIRAEYIIQEMQASDNMNRTGIWDYVSTDQVRFLDTTQHGEVVELVLIPPTLLSEVLRDTDLFTGVASIGNDDQWADSGGEVFQNYFHRYSTRDLSGMGKNRKLALERLIPRLKIRDAVTVDDKYVRVTGNLRKYKIHIGSGNVLMEPNDQYLCIVPAAISAFKQPADRLYLPFEGDRTLSIIISKAFLLAADDEITDVTITRQIKW